MAGKVRIADMTEDGEQEAVVEFCIRKRRTYEGFNRAKIW